MDSKSVDWNKLLDEHSSTLLLYARQWAPSVADAEDAVQDGFLRVWRPGKVRPEGAAPALFAAVRRAAIDRIRSSRRRKTRENKSHDPDAGCAMFETRVEKDERRREIEVALGRLPIEQREVLVMKIWADMTFSAIAESLGISPNTAASRYRYALEALRKHLANN